MDYTYLLTISRQAEHVVKVAPWHGLHVELAFEHVGDSGMA